METIHFTKANSGKRFLLGADVITVKAGGLETKGTMLVLEVCVPAGGGPPTLHRHAYTETFYFLEGEFEISTADSDYRLLTLSAHAGDVVAIPSMAWHNFKNVGDTQGRFLVVHNSTIIEGLLQELGQPLQEPVQQPMLDSRPSATQMQAMLQVLGKYMEFLPPDKLVSSV